MNREMLLSENERAALAGAADPEQITSYKIARSDSKSNVELQEFFEKDLQQSGIDPSDAIARAIAPVDAAQCIKLLGFSPRDQANRPIEGYAIPFIDPVTKQPMTCPDGRPFVRIKLVAPAKMNDGKLAKYLSPNKAGQHAYIPAEVHHAVQSCSADVILTEGEKKAICATLRGMPTIGLVGMWGWRDTSAGDGRGNDQLLPELARYVRSGAMWTLIFDSDAADSTKERDFKYAAARLAKVLAAYQVSLRLVILPPVVPNGKTGLDDYAMYHGPQFLQEIRTLIDMAPTVSCDLRSLTSVANGSKGGRPAVVKDIADACAALFRDVNGVLLLRHYRNTWFHYENGHYGALPAGEMVWLGSDGTHAMFIGPDKRYVVGDELPAVLVFEKAGRVDVTFRVEERSTDRAPGHGEHAQ